MIELIRLNDNEKYYKEIYEWCQNNFVYEWFEQKKLTYDEIVHKYKNKLLNGIQDIYIIRYNNIDIGLVQIYKFINDEYLSLEGNIYEYDLFIGNEKYLNKGIGKEIVNYINNIIYNKYNATSIILRPFKRNERAIKCYEKCNFNIINEYSGTDTLGNSEEIVVLLNNRSKV